MLKVAKETMSNRLIAALSERQRGALVSDGEVVDLLFGDILCVPGQNFTQIHFPLTACISLVAKVEGHPPFEVGLVGNEGMLGASLLLGVRAAPLSAVVQGAGRSLRLPAGRFCAMAKKDPSLRRLLHRYLFVTTSQLVQSTLCARFHEIGPRLARWLLLTHDRANADHFHLTHQDLADMLGVQRSAVTIAAGDLQSRGLIRYSRGEIHIRDRDGLEAASCECYSASMADYGLLFG